MNGSTANQQPFNATMSGFPIFLAHLSHLLPLQRALLLLNLQKAHHWYSLRIQERVQSLNSGSPIPEGEQDLQGVVDLLKECQLWQFVEAEEKRTQEECENWSENAKQNIAFGEYQIIRISGLPYLLNNPVPRPPPAPPKELYISFRRAQEIHHILQTMLQLLLTFSPSAPHIAWHPPSRTTNPLRAHTPTPAAAAAAAVPPPPPQRRRRATLSIVINLEAVIAIIVPLFFLSLKLAFLLYIFTRHASPSKRNFLIGLAVLYVLWTGWTLRNRARGIPPVPVPVVPPQAQAAQRRGIQVGNRIEPIPNVPGQPQLVRIVPAVPEVGRRPIASRLTWRYWLNWVAAINLSHEARELGLIPRSIAGRPVTPPPVNPNSPRSRPVPPNEPRWRRAMRTCIVAFVLFFATIFPEVERKRRKALEKRARLLEERRERDRIRKEKAQEKALEVLRKAATRNAPPAVVVEEKKEEGPVASTASTSNDTKGEEPYKRPILPPPQWSPLARPAHERPLHPSALRRASSSSPNPPPSTMSVFPGREQQNIPSPDLDEFLEHSTSMLLIKKELRTLEEEGRKIEIDDEENWMKVAKNVGVEEEEAGRLWKYLKMKSDREKYGILGPLYGRRRDSEVEKEKGPLEPIATGSAVKIEDAARTPAEVLEDLNEYFSGPIRPSTENATSNPPIPYVEIDQQDLLTAEEVLLNPEIAQELQEVVEGDVIDDVVADPEGVSSDDDEDADEEEAQRAREGEEGEVDQIVAIF